MVDLAVTATQVDYLALSFPQAAVTVCMCIITITIIDNLNVFLFRHSFHTLLKLLLVLSTHHLCDFLSLETC